MATDCTNQTDSLKLVREGTSQSQRVSAALDPASAPVNEHTAAHGMVFAQAYAKFVQYYDANNIAVDNWAQFFRKDVSVLLAVVATQDVASYKSSIKSAFDFLNNLENKSNKDAEIKQHLGFLFSCLGTLAKHLDKLKEELPLEITLKGTLQNLIRSQVAVVFRRLLAYYKADFSLAVADRLISDTPAEFVILGNSALKFSEIVSSGLSKDWITNTEGKWVADNPADWNSYVTSITADASVYGAGTVFERANHLATHNLFTTIFDQFLKVYARVVSEAKEALAATLTKQDNHEPHYALFLAFLRLLESARAEANKLTGRHLDFYYRDILRLKEKPATPGKAHLLVELAKHVSQHELKSGELFKAGKDNRGIDAFFASERALVANQAKVAELKTVYRHGSEQVGTDANADKQEGRLYAAPVSNSDDGAGAELTSTDQSWHPFFNKTYPNGKLQEIQMPKAEIGFAVASHYLYLNGGYRRIKLDFTLKVKLTIQALVTVYLTTEKGWLPVNTILSINDTDKAILLFALEADAPAIRPYNQKVHGGDFQTEHPIAKVLLRHDADQLYDYAKLESINVTGYTISVAVGLDESGKPSEAKPGLKSLAVSNDLGPIDTAKPFQPFGPAPQTGASLTLGSREVTQKNNLTISLKIVWRGSPNTTPVPDIQVYYLSKAAWSPIGGKVTFNQNPIEVTLPAINIDVIDYTPDTFFTADATGGFLKISLDGDFGHKSWQKKLITHFARIAKGKPSRLPATPYTPEIENISLCYSATSDFIRLDSTEYNAPNGAKFYHLYPFGLTEQHPGLSGNAETFLLPQFSAAEFYIGVTDLKPPQNLALLFQVADGTANPLAQKANLHWSYLCNNEWKSLASNEVEDHTDGFLNSGIISFAMPRDASDSNTILPTGMHWLRVAVADNSDAVCRLRMVAAQALAATFTDKGNDPAFPAQVLTAGTISKLGRPDAAVKKITQPFATFDGRGAENSLEFYTRISERLRHKDRAIALWDYEHLILEAFPQIYKVKCLNHTKYQDEGYRELAAGHVTIVTIPNLQLQNLRDPLKPYTSLGLLTEIEKFLSRRLACFVKLHVKNPRFEEVFTEFEVRFYDGFDETFYQKKLQEELTRFLSPWAFSGGGSPTFGGKIYKSVLLNFIEERPYVDYVANFKLFHKYQPLGQQKEVTSPDLSEVEGSTAVSILVSAPIESHVIKPFTTGVGDQSPEKCRCEV